MNLSTSPFRWFSLFLLFVLGASTLAFLGSTLWRPEPPRISTTPALPSSTAPPLEAKARPLRGDNPQAPQVWLIAIGIDQYPDEAIPAATARSATPATSGVGSRGPRAGTRRTSCPGRPGTGGARGPRRTGRDLLPTKKNLEWAFDTWLKARVRRDDTIVVFYAGQAVPCLPPRTRPRATSGGRISCPSTPS